MSRSGESLATGPRLRGRPSQLRAVWGRPVGHAQRFGFAGGAWGFTLAAAITIQAASAQTQPVRVELKLQTGGSIGGDVLDYNEHGLVVVHEDTPYVFAWNELEAGCAYATRRTLRALRRGGAERMSAEDHFQLGRFALWLGRSDLAADEFRRATKRDPGYRNVIRHAVDEDRRRRDAAPAPAHPLERSAVSTVEVHNREPDRAGWVEGQLADLDRPTVVAGLAPGPRARVRDAYQRFGAKVQEVIGSDVVLIETEHFLIWTDWERRFRGRLARWCDAMYGALCGQFELDPAVDVFLAKCPVFCWRSRTRFQRFARYFDGFDAAGAVGYTRSIAENGHVHVVLLRLGRSEADFDRVACTLVHEGTHAFLHRLYSPRLLPHWVNEGYADLMAERVLGDRCPAGEKAALLAGQYVRHDWPIADLLTGVGPIAVSQYPIAHSVVAYLESLGRRRLVGWIKDLKAGKTVAGALAAHYDQMSLEQLESRWRAAVRSGLPVRAPTQTGRTRTGDWRFKAPAP